METVSKTELADHLGISAARVSQFIAQGLPVLSDGKIHLGAALKWITANNLGETGNRAREMLKKIQGEGAGNPVDAAITVALGLLVARIPMIAAEAAREAGAPADVVDRMPAIAHALACKAGEGVTELLGMEPRGEWPSPEACAEAID